MVASDLKAESFRLMDKRSAVEAEISTIAARLTAPGAPGLTGNLIDEQGYPRSDIDIMAVRADRHRLAVLHTDHKEITGKIEANIHILHAASISLPQKRAAPEEDAPPPARSPPSTSAPAPSNRPRSPPPAFTSNPYALPSPPPQSEPMEEDEIANGAPVNGSVGPSERAAPFAVIDEVTEGSPGQIDGFEVGDLLLKFGEVSAGEDCVAHVARELQRNEGRPLFVVVSRRGTQIAFVVCPRTWAGRGLLGCHMRPI